MWPRKLLVLWDFSLLEMLLDGGAAHATYAGLCNLILNLDTTPLMRSRITVCGAS
jgi:hypothetical protein